MPQYDKADIERRMKGAVDALKSDLQGLRTGRANTSLLDPVVVEVYGSIDCRSIRSPTCPRPNHDAERAGGWDKSNPDRGWKRALPIAKPWPQPDHTGRGQDAALAIPDLTQETPQGTAKLAGQYAEKAKIAIRNVRRDAMESLKTDEKKKDNLRGRAQAFGGRESRKLTQNQYVKDTDEAAAKKEKEILTQ